MLLPAPLFELAKCDTHGSKPRELSTVVSSGAVQKSWFDRGSAAPVGGRTWPPAPLARISPLLELAECGTHGAKPKGPSESPPVSLHHKQWPKKGNTRASGAL